MNETKAHDAKVVQDIAVALWGAATSEDDGLAWSRSTVYRSLERALIAAIRSVYEMSQLKAERVRDLLAEYGPDDSLQGTGGRGIASYVEFVKRNRTSSSYDR